MRPERTGALKEGMDLRLEPSKRLSGRKERDEIRKTQKLNSSQHDQLPSRRHIEPSAARIVTSSEWIVKDDKPWIHNISTSKAHYPRDKHA